MIDYNNQPTVTTAEEKTEFARWLEAMQRANEARRIIDEELALSARQNTEMLKIRADQAAIFKRAMKAKYPQNRKELLQKSDQLNEKLKDYQRNSIQIDQKKHDKVKADQAELEKRKGEMREIESKIQKEILYSKLAQKIVFASRYDNSTSKALEAVENKLSTWEKKEFKVYMIKYEPKIYLEAEQKLNQQKFNDYVSEAAVLVIENRAKIKDLSNTKIHDTFINQISDKPEEIAKLSLEAKKIFDENLKRIRLEEQKKIEQNHAKPSQKSQDKLAQMMKNSVGKDAIFPKEIIKKKEEPVWER